VSTEQVSHDDDNSPNVIAPKTFRPPTGTLCALFAIPRSSVELLAALISSHGRREAIGDLSRQRTRAHRGDVVRVSAAIISWHLLAFSLFASGAQEVQFQQAAFFFPRARKVNRAPSFIRRVPHTWRPRPNVYLFRFRGPIIAFATGACNDLRPPPTLVCVAISLGFLPLSLSLSLSLSLFPPRPGATLSTAAATRRQDTSRS
jgi:hypothetical protein